MILPKPNISYFLSLAVIISFGLSVSAQTADFRSVVEERLAKKEIIRNGKKTKGIRLKEVCDVENDSVAERVFRDYGAMFIADSGILMPAKCVFADEQEVTDYQTAAKTKTQNIGGTTITLQEDAMEALQKAIAEAAKMNLKITPRGGSIAARRSFKNTLDLWNSRFNPGLKYWTGKGKIPPREAANAKNLSIQKQVAQVLAWEKKGYFFSKDFSKSILYSVAAPGASQHIFMLALDVEQFADSRVRQILADHGWFQTVLSDLPHFTYLGADEKKLPKLGLEQKVSGGQKFWIPNLK